MRLTAKFLLVAFLLSGAVFLAYPDQHYNETGWGVLVKYAIYAAMLGLLVLYWLTGGRMRRDVIVIFVMWLIVLSVALMAGASPARIGLYLVPATALFAPISVRDSFAKMAALTLLATVAGAVYEYYVLGGFARFHPAGYRGVSIFINPNNLAITVTILCAYVAMHWRGSIRWMVLAIGAGLVVYSGSRTGAAIFLVLVFSLIVKDSSLRLAVFGVPAIVVGIAALLFGAIEIRMDSLYLRLEQYSAFLYGVENGFFPFRGFDLNADNAFIKTWIEVGTPGLLVFCFVLLYVATRDGLKNPLWLIFGLAATSTNILYLFPVGYLFWFYVGSAQWTSSPGLNSRSKALSGPQPLPSGS